jgi:hypothetical protein
MQTKSEFLASIKAPDYHPPAQAVTEQSSVEVYGDSAVVVGVFRTKGVDKGKKYLNRERFVDTWVKISGTWKCVAAITVLIPSKQSSVTLLIPSKQSSVEQPVEEPAFRPAYRKEIRMGL